MGTSTDRAGCSRRPRAPLRRALTAALRPLSRGGYRGELLVLLLVAVAALAVVSAHTPQDVTRITLTRALVEDGTVRIDPYAAFVFDRAEHGGHAYSDKAPGWSLAAVPSFALLHALGVAPPAEPSRWHGEGDLRVWAMRVLTSGLLFLLAVLLVGRVAERVARGTGAGAATLFGLGTLAQPLAASGFGHIAAGAAAFAGFALAWRATLAGQRLRPGLLAAAGLAAGLSVLIEYQAALLAALVALYAARRGLRALALVAGGALPAVGVLAAYDAVAFGSPFRLSYRYVANRYAEQQRGGLFGIGVPHADTLWHVLAGDRGLVVVSPVLVAAAVGLVLLWRQGLRAEALTCAAATTGFLVVNAGYFLPYGGNSPGPRFFAPALPFLAVGLAPALRRFPLPTLALGAVSIVGSTIVSLSWTQAPESGYPGTVWGQVAHSVVSLGNGFGDTLIVRTLSRSLWSGITGDRITAGAVGLAVGLAALALAAALLRAGRQRLPGRV
jgi:hypothetical protein